MKIFLLNFLENFPNVFKENLNFVNFAKSKKINSSEKWWQICQMLEKLCHHFKYLSNNVFIKNIRHILFQNIQQTMNKFTPKIKFYRTCKPRFRSLQYFLFFFLFPSGEDPWKCIKFFKKK